MLEQNGPPGDTAPGRKLQCSKRPVRAIGAFVGPEEEENGGQKKVFKSFFLRCLVFDRNSFMLFALLLAAAGWLLLVLLQWKL